MHSYQYGRNIICIAIATIFAMRYIRIEEYMETAVIVSVARIFRALSDPTRLRILNLLLSGELCVCDIVNTLKIPQPTVSRHLAYLRKLDLVQARRNGLWIHYSLSSPGTTFHKRLIDCLRSCVQELPQLADDAKQLTRSRCC